MTLRSVQGRPSCSVQESGTIELYFYGELTAHEREAVDQHLPGCRLCRSALEELALIRDALAARPVVAAPPSGDWSQFMARLDSAMEHEAEASAAGNIVPLDSPRPDSAARSFVAYLAMAALLALVTVSVYLASRSRDTMQPSSVRVQAETAPPSSTAPADPNASLAEVSGQHLERSKLVVLGLATKDAHRAGPQDWIYERQLASSLLTDTRLYRMAAEDQGMESLARVMRDLELVLLQASLSEDTEPAALAQIQRLIEKRDLLGRMDVVNTAGL